MRGNVEQLKLVRLALAEQLGGEDSEVYARANGNGASRAGPIDGDLDLVEFRAVMREYVKALALSNQLSRLSLNMLAQHHPAIGAGGLAFECVANDISGYPTWIIDGRRYQQVLTPDQLAARSGFVFKEEER